MKQVNKGQELYAEAKRLIAGGSNLYSKRAELHSPDRWPCYYESARGVTVRDVSGNEWLDFSGASVGACGLGYGDDDVDQAVIRAIAKGSTSSLLCPEEVELAKLLTLLHPWSRQVRYTRSGGEAIAVAIRIAQAYNKRRKVLSYGYHGWHINDPVYNNKALSDNILALRPEDYNNFMPALAYAAELAAIVIEPSRLIEPNPGFLEQLRQITETRGTVLIFDEISSGFRRNLGGVHLNYGVNPDIAVFSKAMANGYPMAAVVGTEEVMSATQDTFISSTTWSERIGPTAAIATIHKMWAEDVFDHTKYIGELVRGTIEYEAKRSGVKVTVSGPPQMLHFDFGSPEVQTAYTNLMLERGILAGRDFYAMYAHTLEDCEKFSAAVKEVFPLLADVKPTEVVEIGIRR